MHTLSQHYHQLNVTTRLVVSMLVAMALWSVALVVILPVIGETFSPAWILIGLAIAPWIAVDSVFRRKSSL